MNSPKLILWIIWVSLLSFPVYCRFAYGAEMPEKEPLNIIFVILVSCLLIGSLICRVLVLPRQDNPFAFFVGRLAAAEGAMLLGVLLIPYYQVFVLAMTLACMVTYFPHLIKAPNPVDGSKKP